MRSLSASMVRPSTPGSATCHRIGLPAASAGALACTCGFRRFFASRSLSGRLVRGVLAGVGRNVGQRDRAADRRRELPVDLRPASPYGRREVGEYRRQPSAVRSSYVSPDLDERCVDAGAEHSTSSQEKLRPPRYGTARRSFAGKHPSGHWRRGASTASSRTPGCADLAHRLEQEHRVEGGDLEHPDLGHAEHLGDDADRRLVTSLPAPAPARERDHAEACRPRDTCHFLLARRDSPR